MGDPPCSWMVYVFGKFETWMSLTGPHLAIPEAVVHHLSTGKNRMEHDGTNDGRKRQVVEKNTVCDCEVAGNQPVA